jgi:hypothetical protein
MLQALILTVALAGAGQDVPPPRASRPAAAGLTNGELISMLDTYAIVQAQVALQLDDAQYGQFVTRLKRLQEMRRRNMQARNRMLQELRRMTAPGTPVDDPAIRERLKVRREHDDRAAVELRRAYDAVDEILDARQQVRFRLFEEQMERKKLELLMRARDRAGRRGGT